LYRSAFSWKVLMYIFLTVTFILLIVVIVFLVVTSNQSVVATAVC